MGREYGVFERGGEAKRLLRQRLQRKEMGDEAYEKMTSYADDRAFKIFGALFIVLVAAIVLIVIWLEG